MDWKHLLVYITGTVDQALLPRNEYLVTENRILRNQITGRVRLTNSERKTLAEIGQKLGKQALEAIATIVKPDTILGWHRTLVAQKFDGSAQRKAPGRPKVAPELGSLIVRMAQENRSWGYDRIVGALANLGLTVSAQTVGNVLKRHGIAPAPERKTTTWKEFIRTHLEVLVATDFFTAKVWTLGGLVTYYVLFGGVSNVDIDGKNTLSVKAIGAAISTFETLSGIGLVFQTTSAFMLHRWGSKTTVSARYTP
jgi:hypothetical protein